MAGPGASKGLRAWIARYRRRWAGLSVQERNALYLCGTSGCLGPIQAGVGAYLAVFLARLGASAEQIGWLTSVPAMANMVLMIPAGLVAERVRDQVRLRTLGAVVMRSVPLLLAVAPAVFTLSAIPNVAVALVALQSAALAITLPAFMTVMSDAVAPQQRSRVNAARWALMNVVSALLVPFFGRMLDVVDFPRNYQILFAFSFLGGIGNLYFFSRIKVPPLEVREHASWRPHNLREGLRSYLASVRGSREFVLFVLGTVAFRVVRNMPLPLYSLFWVNELHASDGLIGLRETAAYSGLVLGYLAWGKWAPRMQQRRQLFVSVLLLGLYCVATALIPSAPWMVPVAAIWGLAMSGVNIGLFNIMLTSVSKERMPRLSAVLNVVSSAGASVGPALGVALSQATSMRMALLIVGAAIILSTVPFRVLPSEK